MKQKEQGPDRVMDRVKFEEEAFSYRYIIKIIIGLIIPVLCALMVYSALQRNYASLAILVLICVVDIVILLVDRTALADHTKIRINGVLLKFQVLSLGIFLLAGMGIAGNWELLPWTYVFCYLAVVINGIAVGVSAVTVLGGLLLAAFIFLPQPAGPELDRLMVRFFPTLFLCAAFSAFAEYVRADYRRKLTEASEEQAASEERYREILEKDIAERKRVEASLKKSETLFNLITAHTSAMVSIHDPDGNYLYASPSHRQLGYSPEELVGKSGFTLVVEDDTGLLIDHLARAKQGEMSNAVLEYRLRDRQGNIRYCRASFDAAFLSDGALEKIVCIGEDITQLREAREEKLDAMNLAAEIKQMALVGRIAGKLSHDFNNILSGIMGNADYALLDCQEPETRKALELIFDQTVRGKNLTKNLVAFARDQEPRQAYFSIDKKIELVLNLLKKELDGIRVAMDFEAGKPDLLADPGMIEHALVNLVQNAIHAVSLADRPTITIRTCHLEDGIQIEIRDNGCGIPAQFMDAIFEPAFTLKGSKDRIGAYSKEIKGTGYGMSNVKKYIEQHRGTIRVDSEAGEGTCCTIILPLLAKELTEQEVIAIQQEITRPDRYILVVEDEAVISGIQTGILTRDPCRHRVDVAENGRSAMACFDRNVYDLVSLDYMLPGDFSGMDVYRHIREKNRTVPILFVSGNIEFLESVKQLKQEDPHIDHLSKPFPNKEYIRAVHGLLERG